MGKKSFEIKLGSDAEFITEAFGISDGFVKEIYDVEIPEFENILYITGESGSGKTVMMKENFKETTIEFQKDKPVYQLLGDNWEENLQWLSFVGLGDATIYPLNYNQLSDSQQKRLELLLKTLSTDLIVVDEFLSTLDRKTAKAVSYAFQKMIRKLGKMAVLVTAHDDLEDYLKPDAVVKGLAFPSRFEAYSKTYSEPFENIEFYYGDKYEYKELRLGELHYRGKYTGGVKEYLFCTYRGDVVGILVSTNLIGREGRKIARVVIHPTYRGCGIGKELVKKYIHDYPLTEVIAVMAKYNPVFEKAGMIRVEDSIVKSPPNLKKKLKEIVFNESRWHNKEYCNEVMKSYDNRTLLSEFSKYAKKYVQPGGRQLSEEEIAQQIVQDEVTAGRVLYLFRDKEYAKYKTNEMNQILSKDKRTGGQHEL